MYMILQIIATYYTFLLTEYIFHSLGHIPHKWNLIHKLHITHHKDYYPITKLTSDKYESGGEGMIAYVPPSLIISFIMYLILDRQTYIISTIQLLLHAIINDYIHSQIHTTDSWLERYKWFQSCRRSHFIHHRKLTKNFAFGYDYTIDKIRETYIK
jgi:sterol desaturase/sphingolipid hydroxylase (fatty acid hydroxylase superfamily)